ncbi:ubiquitin-protein ligase [Lithospermum erythrorhizon]|uniref:HECT-type E3 ubiquitin transferase n=1 Tax=Lithospermum erythrorhizon TaxID=34254 RepID=A0AAV3RRH3_LITER
METRGQKRTDIVEELPADKRACSSLDFRPSTSSSSAQTLMSPPNEPRDADMDTSSSTSGARSEGDAEKDSAYGSCDSDNSFRDYQRYHSRGDHSKFETVLSNLSKEEEQSGQLAALTELCEMLSFCTDSSLSSWMADSYSPVLVKLARHETNPDIMLLAIRSITYLCDLHPRSSAFLVRHDAVPAICQRLMAIEYLDVAEQCLQALEKISREQPLACLQSGAIMAVLSYIDFFSTSVQRVALSTVVNICKKLPSECYSSFTEAVPILCNLLQYEDRQLVESVATCLTKMVDCVCLSPDMLDEFCKHGLVQQATHIVRLNSRTTLSPPTYAGLLGSLVKLASGSNLAFRVLYELNISHIIKEIIPICNLPRGPPSMVKADDPFSQVYEVLKLLNVLLPAIPREQDVHQPAEKEAFFISRPDLLQNFGVDLLPALMQVVDSGANLHVTYGCLVVIHKLCYFSNPEILHEFLRSVNISSFLAGVITRKDRHVLLLALQIIDTVLQKLSDVFLNSFVKEGVFYAIEALLSPENCSQSMVSQCSSSHMPTDARKKSASKDSCACLCSYMDSLQSSPTPENNTCNVEEDAVQKLAEHIRTTYHGTELIHLERGWTGVLHKLKSLSTSLLDLVNTSKRDPSSTYHEEFCKVLHEILSELNSNDPISTFEFVESGLAHSLVNFLSNGQDLRSSNSELYIVERRFEILGKLLLSASGAPLMNSLHVLVQRLQNALSVMENFPVVLIHTPKLRNSYAVVPHQHCTSYPCLKVQFVKGENETRLGDYSGDVVTVDPLSPMDAIEAYLWGKVGEHKTEPCASHDKSQERDSDSKSIDEQEVQENDNLAPSATGEIANSSINSADLELHHCVPGESEQKASLFEETNNASVSSGNSCCEDVTPKLSLYLEEQQLDNALTLYQALLQLQMKKEQDFVTNTRLWNQIHRISFKRVPSGHDCAAHLCHLASSPPSFNQSRWWQYSQLFSGLLITEVFDVEEPNPINDILTLLRSLEGINRLRLHLMYCERIFSYAEGRTEDLDNLRLALPISQKDLVNTKLTEKLEQQMQDPFASYDGGMPAWCTKLLSACPFLFSFESRCKYFRLVALGQRLGQSHSSSHSHAGLTSPRSQSNNGYYPRKKFMVDRDRILDSATQMMDLHASHKVIIEVEYNEEVGTGLGPTLEFYTLVSHEFQKCCLGMWREDHLSLGSKEGVEVEDFGILVSRFGLFPRPWSAAVSTSNSKDFSEVLKRFVLLGHIVAKAFQDGRVLDLPFSKAFYKLILGKELSIFDILSFDPELGRALLEFQALVERKRFNESIGRDKSMLDLDLSFRDSSIEDLCLDFTLPGFHNYALTTSSDLKMVDLSNLEEYISLVVDATIKSGISRQIEAFKSGFTQVLPVKHLHIFSEEEFELLICGERELWHASDLSDHVKFDHGYTSSSPPVLNLLEIMQEFDSQKQRAFLQFVTGAPRLPLGGLASLNPKLTIVRKHCSVCPDDDLPSVMTCANYLKLPSYSSKEKMKEKLTYAITEGQGSFHLS